MSILSLNCICVVGDIYFKIYSGFYSVQEILGLKYGLLIDAFCTFRHLSFPQNLENGLVLAKPTFWLESVLYKYFIECIKFSGIIPQADRIRIEVMMS